MQVQSELQSKTNGCIFNGYIKRWDNSKKEFENRKAECIIYIR